MESSILLLLAISLGCLAVGFLGGTIIAGFTKKHQLEELRLEADSMREKNLSLLELKTKAEAKTAELESRQGILQEQFKASANSILLELAKTNREKHSEELDTIITPLKKQIEEFKKETKTYRETDIKEKATLKQEISNLNALSTGLGEKTEGLSQVLRGDERRHQRCLSGW